MFKHLRPCSYMRSPIFSVPFWDKSVKFFLHLPVKNPKFSTISKITDKIILKKNQNNFVAQLFLLYLYKETLKHNKMKNSKIISIASILIVSVLAICLWNNSGNTISVMDSDGFQLYTIHATKTQDISIVGNNDSTQSILIDGVLYASGDSIAIK